MRVMSAETDAEYEKIGSCHAFPAEAFHRSGTTTSSTVKFVVGYMVLKPESGEESKQSKPEVAAANAGAGSSEENLEIVPDGSASNLGSDAEGEGADEGADEEAGSSGVKQEFREEA